MAQMGTKFDAADNSGAKILECIKVLGGSHRMDARIGDIIVVSVKEATPKGKVKKGEVLLAVIVRTKEKTYREDGTDISFDSNAAVVINKQREPVGSRVFGPVPRELRSKKYMKIISLAPEVV